MLAAAATAVLLIGAPQAHAAACTTSWTNASGGRWTIPSNWDSGVPDSNDVACIQLAGTYQVEIRAFDGDLGNATATAKELHFGGLSGTQTLLIQGAEADAADRNASLTLAGGAGSASDVGLNGVVSLQATGAGNNGSICAGSPLTNGGRIETGGTPGLARILGGNVKNQGDLAVGVDATVPLTQTCGANVLENAGGDVTIGNSRTLAIAGSYLQGGGSTDLGADGRMTVAGSLTMTGGTVTGSRQPVVEGGTLAPSSGTGTFTMHDSTLGSGVGPNVTLNIEGTATDNTVVTNSGPATNQGTINLINADNGHGSFLRASNGTLTNTGTIATPTGAGGFRRFGGTIDNQGTFSVTTSNTASELDASQLHLTTSGDFTVSSSGAFGMSDLTQTGGTVTVDGVLGEPGAAYTVNGGTFKGTGTVEASLTNNGGTVQPGHSPGVLTIQGDYTQAAGGTLDVEVQGSDPGTGFDRLGVTGNAVLGGTLKVTTTGAQPGFFQILVAQQVTGSFAGKTFVGQNHAVLQNSTSVTLLGPPVNTTKPSISGAPRVGRALTCIIGVWASPSSNTTFAYRWLRDGVPITGAIAPSRKPTAADQGHKLRCRVTVTNEAGSGSALTNPVSVPREPVERGRFTKTTLNATKAGDLEVPVRNPNPLAAAGDLTLRNAGNVVGHLKFQIAKQSTKTVTVHLKAGVFAKLKQKGQVPLGATLVLSKGAVKRTASTTLTVKKPKP
ncbi:MAG TPA: hypothetical protein VJT75_13585 [Thermoleophilaceae bacterium]|nr:hypothetical protein [Thermoleophilaceae bacterium]